MAFAAAALLAIMVIGWQGSSRVDQDALQDNDLPFGSQLTLEGHFGYVYGDLSTLAGDGESLPLFVSDTGEIYELMDVDWAVVRGHTEVDYRITGTLLDADPLREDDLPLLALDSMTPLEALDARPTAVTGNVKWVNIACRFGDMDAVTPREMDYFQGFMGDEQPGMDHYWRQTSAERVNIDGSASYGWYDLPKSKADYEKAARLNIGLALQALMNDCVKLAQQQDNVDFTQFGGINMMLNDRFGCCAWGGRMPLRIGEETVSYRTTWLPPWAYNDLHVIAHEMGHGWGLPHSSGPYGQVYDSAWDVMSGGSRMTPECRLSEPDYGCVQVGTIGYHLEMLGWLPQERIATVERGSSATLTIEALTTQQPDQQKRDMLLVNVPVREGRFYTVEVRNFINYDRNVPGEAVVLHEVQPSRREPAKVVDGDNNGNPNDEGAMWLPGETYDNRDANIKVEVLGRTGTTFTVRISNG
jgi:hypothetical protein